jgi:putative ATP-grasp target RiPP
MHQERSSATPLIPWALRRVSELGDAGTPTYARVEIDPLTQMARYVDADGAVVDPLEAGKHGSIQNTYKPVRTGKDGKTDTDSEHDATRD